MKRYRDTHLFVDQNGNVFSERLRGSKFGTVTTPWQLKPHVKPNGYKIVTIRPHEYAYVHAMVLEVFKGKRPSGAVSRHLNGVRIDNRVDNLEWGTWQENNGIDKTAHGTQNTGVRHGQAKLNDQKVREIRKLRRQGVTIRELAKQYGVCREVVRLAGLGVTWRHVDG